MWFIYSTRWIPPSGRRIRWHRDGEAVTKQDLFHVEERFRGTGGDFVAVHHFDSGGMCDSSSFRIGHRYLVVARNKPHIGQLSVGACNHGAEVALAGGDIHVLRLLLRGNPLPEIYGSASGRNQQPLAGARVVLYRRSYGNVVVHRTRTSKEGYFRLCNPSARLLPGEDISAERRQTSSGLFWS